MACPLNLQWVARLCIVSFESGWGDSEEGESDPFPGVFTVGLLTGHQARIGQ